MIFELHREKETKSVNPKDDFNLQESLTHGYFFFNGNKMATLELPWRDNKRSVSCIPSGQYELVYNGLYHRLPSWHIKNVPDRSEILIHVGNTYLDTRGCILLAELRNGSRIERSSQALNKFLSYLISINQLDQIHFIKIA